MALVVESTSQNSSATDVNTLVVSAPSGIQEDEFLVAYVGWYDIGTNRTISTPSGWTSVYNRGSNREGSALFVKQATSADEVAANYTFTWSAETNYKAAGILRISGAAPGSGEGGVESDQEVSPTGTTATYTTTLTPEVSETLLVSCFLGVDNAIDTGQTVGSYSSSPSLTFTERIDTTAQSGGASGDGIVIGVATAPVSGTSEITSRSAVFSTDITRYRSGVALLINAPQSVTANISHNEISTEIFGVTAKVNVNLDISMVDASPTLEGIETKATAPTQWTNETKPSTTWTNEQK